MTAGRRRANAVAIDPVTGAITLAGFAGPDVAVARYTAAGAPDTTFGTGGKVIANMGSVHDIGYAVGFDGQGRIAVAGRTEGDLFVARFLEDGTADMSFNTTGRQVVAPGADASAAALAFDSDDSIVVAGVAAGHATILRFDEDGAMDALVGSGTGYVTAAAFDAPYSSLYSVSVDNEGRILAGGSLGGQRMIVARYNADGTPDATFGGGPAGGTGWTSAYISTNRGEADAIGAVSADGMITAVGTSLGAEGGMYNFAIGRFLPDNAVTVHANAPTVSIADGGGNPSTPIEGDTFHLALSASANPGEDPITSWVIHAGPRDVTVDGNPTTYDLLLPSGEYDITADAVGEEGVYPATGSIHVSITNIPLTLPTANVTVTRMVDDTDVAVTGPVPEGSVITAFADAHDAGGDDLLAYSWAVTKNGNAFASGTDQAVTFVLDDEGTYVAIVVVTDPGGATVTATRTITATNVAPTVHFGEDFDVDEGETVNLKGWASDEGEADGLTYEWTVTDPDDNEVASGTSEDVTFVPEKPGVFSVEMVVTDDSDAASEPATVDVTVNNVAPMIFAPGAPTTVSANGQDTLPLSLDDAGADDVLSYDVDWGDGTAHATGEAPGGTAAPAHAYAGFTAKGNHYQLDERTVTITATDQDDASTSDSFPLAADYRNNFDDNDAGGWTGQSQLFGDGNHYFALRATDGTLTLNRSNVAAHAGLLIEFDLLLGGVDGEWKAEDLDFPTTQFTATLGGATIEPESIDVATGSGEPLPQPIEGLSYYAVSWHVRYVVPDASSTLTLALTGSGLRTGDEDQDFGINNVHIAALRAGPMTAFRAGGKSGEPVYRNVMAGGDASKYLLLVNTDDEEGHATPPPAGTPVRDMDDAVIGEPDQTDGTVDDDLGQLTLGQVPAWMTGGSVELTVSDPTAVRLFKNDGTMLRGPAAGGGAVTGETLSFDVASIADWDEEADGPLPYLAGLMGDDLSISFEALKPSGDLTITLTYKDQGGAPLSTQAVHVTLAEWKVVRGDGEVNKPVYLTGIASLQEAVAQSQASAPLSSDQKFKNSIAGLPATAVQKLRAFDPSNRGDHFDDTLSDGISEFWAAAYDGVGGETLNESERSDLRTRFSLNALVGGRGISERLTTTGDVFSLYAAQEQHLWKEKTTGNPQLAAPQGDEVAGDTYEDAYRRWVRDQLGDNGAMAGTRDGLDPYVAGIKQANVGGKNYNLSCSLLTLWPLLTFASWYHLPVQLEDDNGDLWKLWNVDNAGKITGMNKDYGQPRSTGGTMAQQLVHAFTGGLTPQNLLNWRKNDDGADVALQHSFTDGKWGIIDDSAQKIVAANAPGRAIATRGTKAEDLLRVKVGDVVSTASFASGWPGDQKSIGHSDVITNIRKLENGKVTLDSELYLMYNSSFDGIQRGDRPPSVKQWVSLRSLISGQKHDNNNGYFYVVRSLDFSAFNQLFQPVV